VKNYEKSSKFDKNHQKRSKKPKKGLKTSKTGNIDENGHPPKKQPRDRDRPGPSRTGQKPPRTGQDRPKRAPDAQNGPRRPNRPKIVGGTLNRNKEPKTPQNAS